MSEQQIQTAPITDAEATQLMQQIIGKQVSVVSFDAIASNLNQYVAKLDEQLAQVTQSANNLVSQKQQVAGIITFLNTWKDNKFTVLAPFPPVVVQAQQQPVAQPQTPLTLVPTPHESQIEADTERAKPSITLTDSPSSANKAEVADVVTQDETNGVN